MIEIPFTFPVLALGAIISQGMFVGLVLMGHRINQPANRLLALLIWAFSLWLIDGFLGAAKVYEQKPSWYFLPIFYSLGFGPLLYLYVRTLINPQLRIGWRQALHVVPMLGQGVFYLLLQTQDYAYRRWFWFEIHRPYTYNLEFNLSLMSLLLYSLLALKHLRRYQRWLGNHYSEISHLRLKWLRLILLLMAGLSLLWLGDAFLRELWQVYPAHSLSEVAMGLIILVLAMGSLWQGSLTGTGYVEEAPATRTSKPEISAPLLEKIRTTMVDRQLFLNPDLSLKQFASEVGEPPRRVSEHLNHGLETSFIDFVNQCRVEEVKRKLAAGALETHTLLAVALESGFNSKSTFHRVFKRMTGYSPRNFAALSQNGN